MYNLNMFKLYVSLILLCFLSGLFFVPRFNLCFFSTTGEGIAQVAPVAPTSDFGIIGIRCHGDNPPLVTIYRVQNDTPAMRAGIKAGDRLISIDGHKIKSDRKHQIRPLLKGAAGSTVKIEVERGISKLQFTVKRAGFNELQNEDSRNLYKEIDEFEKRWQQQMQDSLNPF